jgi:AraC family transcriptional regulator
MANGEELALSCQMPPAAGASLVTLKLSGEALGALQAYLRSGAARGLPFEQPLREALGANAVIAPRTASPPGARRTLSARTLRQVHEFIEANLARDISVEDIAHAACVSPWHLGRGYRQATGQSLWQHVLQRRAERGRTLIAAQPATPLAEIATLCGFESYGQFIAAFRKAYGRTPGSYRRELDRGDPP